MDWLGSIALEFVVPKNITSLLGGREKPHGKCTTFLSNQRHAEKMLLFSEQRYPATISLQLAEMDLF